MIKTNGRTNTTTVKTRTGSVTSATTTASRKKGNGTARQQRRAELLERIRLAYWALSPAARSGFRRLCRLMPQNQVITRTGTRLKIGPFLLFSTLSQAAYYASGSSVLPDPPLKPETCDPLPDDLALVSHYDTHGVWSLRLTGSGYDNSVAVALAPPADIAANYRTTDYVQAGPLPAGIPALSGGADLTALFLSVYPAAPMAGEQVGAQVMGVLPSGFATGKTSLSTVTTSGLVEAGDTDDETEEARRAA